jgi:hypothetical protein
VPIATSRDLGLDLDRETDALIAVETVVHGYNNHLPIPA